MTIMRGCQQLKNIDMHLIIWMKMDRNAIAICEAMDDFNWMCCRHKGKLKLSNKVCDNYDTEWYLYCLIVQSVLAPN